MNTTEQKDNTEQHQKQLEAIQTKLERLEERHILEEITSDMFAKYQAKFKAEAVEIQKLIHQSPKLVSNPTYVTEMALHYAKNMNEMWVSSSFQEKVRLQNLIFPEDLVYSKKNDECRTPRIDTTFLQMLIQAQALGQKKIGIPQLNLKYADLVVL